MGVSSATLVLLGRNRALESGSDGSLAQGWEIPRLLGSMWDAPDFYLDSIDQIRLESWSKGRVVLVGDASYCASTLSGQGTSLALVGAYVLAGELAAAAGDHRTAFATYEREVRDYVELSQKTGGRNGKQFLPPTRLRLWFANQNMRMLPYLPWKGLILKAIRRPYHAITLKDYQGTRGEARGSARWREAPSSAAKERRARAKDANSV